MHKYAKDNDPSLIASRNCYPQGGSVGLTAFMLLPLKESQPAANEESAKIPLLERSRQEFILGQTEDDLFQARSGRVTFVQNQALTIELILGNSYCSVETRHAPLIKD
jgi:hypothetical protein